MDNLHDGIDYKESIRRAKFDELTKDLLAKTLPTMTKALEDAKMKKEDIHSVILVGGASRIPAVQKKVEEFFNGKKPTKRINPDEAIAHGAGKICGTLICVMILNILVHKRKCTSLFGGL